jgi:hypothetical protein
MRDALDVPILRIDTCSLLDIMRDPRRESVRPHDAVAAHILVEAAESKRLTMLVAPQVIAELGDNRVKVKDETTAALIKLRELVDRVDRVVAAFSAGGKMDTGHLAGHVDRAGALVDHWLGAAFPIAEGREIPARAWDRVRMARTPSRKSRENMKDCTVIETYLDFVSAFRSAGGTAKAVFLSSNAKDYVEEDGVTLKGDLAAEFAQLGLDFQPNIAAAKHSLGL